jgi:hypothetical protein
LSAALTSVTICALRASLMANYGALAFTDGRGAGRGRLARVG